MFKEIDLPNRALLSSVSKNSEVIRFLEQLAEKLNGAAYGEGYATNVAVVVAVGAPNTAYEVGSGLAAGELRGIKLISAHALEISSPGVYLANWSMSIDTSGAGDEIEGGVMIDGVASAKGTGHTEVAASSEASCISGSLLIDTDGTKQISLYVRNHTAARNITVEHASLVLTKQ